MARSNAAALMASPNQLLLNDVVFHQFHVFRSTARIVSDEQAMAEAGNAADVSKSENPSMANAMPADEAVLPANAQPMQPGATEGAAAQPAGEPAAVTTAALPKLPEISVTEASGLPERASSSSSASDATPTLHVSTRLVDVSLVALDKKGLPVTDLKQEELEIYDNGKKVALRYFSPAGAARQRTPQLAAPNAQNFSNRRADAADAGIGDDQHHSIILLIDSSLSFQDLTMVRQQMRTFLKDLPMDERAAIYVMTRGGFEVLQDITTDHTQLADKLSKWTPSAGNMAQAQDQEARNRQKLDYAHNTSDLLSVNGHTTGDVTAQTQALDPQLRQMSDSPSQVALDALAVLGHHLGSVPGHKSLVWIASDNVLADWTNEAANVDVGSRVIAPNVLRAQEAMNEAHVAVYPLDASLLEAGAVDASQFNYNVQLNPAATANQLPGGCGTVSSGSPAGQAAGGGPELTAGQDITTCNNDLHPGRLTAQMKQDTHSIQGVYREIADATGGRTFRRASDITGELNQVAADGRATYQLSFSPEETADGKYHFITVKLAGRKGLNLRYRTGYFYREQPSALIDRFRDAVLQADETQEIGLTAEVVQSQTGPRVQLRIATSDLALAQTEGLWTDKVDVYLAQNDGGGKAHITGQTMVLHLEPGSYQKYLRDGMPFEQMVGAALGTGAVRLIVVDENSGRIGSVTIPASALGKAS